MAEKEPKKNETPEDDFESLSDEEKMEALIQSLEEKSKPSSKAPSSSKDKAPLKDNKNGKVKAAEKKQEPEKNETKQPLFKQPSFKNRIIMIKFGGAYHPNFIINLLISYWVNLVLVVGVLGIFRLGRFPEQIWVPMVFVLMYTGLEWVFREWMIQRFSKVVLMSFGFVYYLGYTFLFFIIDALFFVNIQIFNSETELAAFTGLFMVLRFLMSYLIQKGLNWRKL